MTRKLCVLLCLCLLLAGCGKQPTSPPDSRRLLISAELDSDASGNHAPAEQLGGNYDGDIGYYYLTNVQIQIQEDCLPLEDSIEQGLVSVEELEAYAQMDARKGFCQRKSRSFNSLTVNIFTYPEYELRVINDLYETPDGQQHYIHEFDLARPNTFQIANPPGFFNASTPMDATIDREDWGLDFQVTAASTEGLTLSVTQSGGQQLGKLRLSPRILVFPAEENTMDIRMGNLTETEAAFLPMEGNGEISFAWPEEMGQLPPGSYVMRIYVQDIFDAEAVHPLMRDYTDRQLYHIYFQIS